MGVRPVGFVVAFLGICRTPCLVASFLSVGGACAWKRLVSAAEKLVVIVEVAFHCACSAPFCPIFARAQCGNLDFFLWGAEGSGDARTRRGL